MLHLEGMGAPGATPESEEPAVEQESKGMDKAEYQELLQLIRETPAPETAFDRRINAMQKDRDNLVQRTANIDAMLRQLQQMDSPEQGSQIDQRIDALVQKFDVPEFSKTLKPMVQSLPEHQRAPFMTYFEDLVNHPGEANIAMSVAKHMQNARPAVREAAFASIRGGADTYKALPQEMRQEVDAFMGSMDTQEQQHVQSMVQSVEQPAGSESNDKWSDQLDEQEKAQIQKTLDAIVRDSGIPLAEDMENREAQGDMILGQLQMEGGNVTNGEAILNGTAQVKPLEGGSIARFINQAMGAVRWVTAYFKEENESDDESTEDENDSSEQDSEQYVVKIDDLNENEDIPAKFEIEDSAEGGATELTVSTKTPGIQSSDYDNFRAKLLEFGGTEGGHGSVVFENLNPELMDKIAGLQEELGQAES